MKCRIRQIIELLLSSDHSMKAKSIALALEISERTVREEITYFWDHETSNSLHILSTREGYTVKTDLNENELNTYLDRLDEYFNSVLKERHIITRLLLVDDYIKLEDLADEFYISTPTIYRLFKKIKSILAQYDISVINKPGYGIKLKGSESSLRLCFAHCYTEDLHVNIDELSTKCNMKSEDYYLLLYIIEKALMKEHYELTEVGTRNLVVHLLFAISRIQNGKYIEKSLHDSIVTEVEDKVANDIIQNIEKEFQIQFPESETEYVKIHLLCKRANIGNEEYYVSEEIENDIKEIQHEIKTTLNYDFTKDLELFSLLGLHLEPMISRLKTGIRMPNPVLNEVKSQFSEAYECAIIASNYIEHKYGLHVSEHEIGYLAIHYNLALERIKHKYDQPNVLLVCSTGLGAAKLLELKIQNEFNIDNDHVQTCSLQDLLTKDIEDIDYIVTTIKIPFKLNKRIIYMDNILSDIKIDQVDNKENTLSSYFHSDICSFQQTYKSKEEVLDTMCKKIEQVYELDCDLISLVMQRENLSSTELGNYVAIPHPYSTCTSESFIGFCSLKKAIQWNKKKVKYIFLVAYSKEDLEISHGINEELIAKILDPSFVEKLEKINNFEKLNKLLEEK